MIERGTIRYDHELLARLEHPCFVARGEKNGKGSRARGARGGGAGGRVSPESRGV